MNIKETLRNIKIFIIPFRYVRELLRIILWTPYIAFWFFENLIFKNVLFVEACVSLNVFHLKKSNWGDDLNKYLLENLLHKKIIFIPHQYFILRRKPFLHYSFIGSILGNYNLKNTIICGSGARNFETKIEEKPLNVLCVRGPLTRAVLLDNNIECPAIYGDPALLLPKVYKGCRNVKYKMGIIPHYHTEINDLILDLEETFNAKIIDMSKYNQWTDVIDEILSCDFIISESLHGLIVAEAYCVPNKWVEFMEHDEKLTFKFYDFYESIHKYNMKSLKLYQDSSLNLENLKNSWTKAENLDEITTVLESLYGKL